VSKNQKYLSFSFLLLLAALPLCGQEPEPAVSGVSTAEPLAFFNQRTLLAVSNPDYLVSPGDVYTLTYNREQFVVSQNLIVEPDMIVDLSVFGVLQAQTLTLVEFKQRVEERVQTAYPKSLPRVTMRSTGVFEVYLKGEVKNTGNKLAWGLSRLSEIVEDVLTPYSSIRDVQVTSAKGGTRFYDLFRAYRFGEQGQDPFVRPQDTITVRKYDRQIKVSGEVKRPGSYQILSGENMENLITDYCDGFTAVADLSRVEFYRYKPGQNREEVTYLDVTEGFDREVTLASGDAIFVPSNTELLPIVYFEGAIIPDGADPQEKFVVYRQRQKIRDGETLYTALRSIRLSPQADLTACYIKRKKEKLFIDLDDYLYNYDRQKDVVLQPLDCIVIPYIR
jgi:polysaccharide export outer membrane protein